MSNPPDPPRPSSFVGSAGLTLLSFVIQFCGETNLSEGRLCGRVEHIRSGDASHFQSLDELLAFMKEAIDRGRVV